MQIVFFLMLSSIFSIFLALDTYVPLPCHSSLLARRKLCDNLSWIESLSTLISTRGSHLSTVTTTFTKGGGVRRKTEGGKQVLFVKNMFENSGEGRAQQKELDENDVGLQNFMFAPLT